MIIEDKSKLASFELYQEEILTYYDGLVGVGEGRDALSGGLESKLDLLMKVQEF